MFRAFALAIGQLDDRPIIMILIKSMVITLILFAAIAGAVWYGADYAFDRALAYWGYADAPDWIVAMIMFIGLSLSFLLIFRSIAVPVISFFADQVVAAVETKHYPASAMKAVVPSTGMSVRMALASTARLIVVNFALLPAYGILLLSAVGPFILFLFVNGLLLGRDLGEMVAVRHLDKDQVKIWLRENRWPRAILGLGITFLFMIPIANILAPIIGAAMATHLFHRSST